MEEKKGKKLLKLLNKWGVSPEEAQAFLDDYDNTPDEEEIVENVDDVDTPVETENVDADVEETEPTEPQPTDEPIVEDEVSEEAEEPAVEEPVEEPTDDVLPPVEEEQPEPPMEEPQDGRVAALEGQVEELKSTLEGLSAKLEAALDNLAKSGLVDYVEPEQPIGIDENSTPAIGQTAGTQSVLDRLNSGRKY